MQSRYLEPIILKKATKEKQDNGTRVNVYIDIKTYKVQVEDILDETSVTIYGATINKMYRISTPRHELEKYLKPKLTNNVDNISYYYISYNNAMFTIKAVKNNWVDIEYKESI